MGERQISPAQLRAYNTDGVVPLRGVASPSELALLAAAIERDIADPGPFFHGYESEGGGRFHGNLRLWETDEDLRRFCLESGLPAIARQFMQSEKVNLFYDQLFVKEAHTLNPTRWHNDQPYWPVRGWQVLSFWIALDSTTAETGAVEFIRGSHRWGRWFQPENFGKTNAMNAYERNPDYETMPDINASRGDYDIVSWDLEPGDAYLFHALTVHGSPGNRSQGRRRRGYTVRYTGDDIVYDARLGVQKGLLNSTLADGAPLDSQQFPVVLNAGG